MRGHPADHVSQLILGSPTTSPDQLLLTITKSDRQINITMDMLSQVLCIILSMLKIKLMLYSLHNFRSGEGHHGRIQRKQQPSAHQASWDVEQRCFLGLSHSPMHCPVTSGGCPGQGQRRYIAACQVAVLARAVTQLMADSRLVDWVGDPRSCQFTVCSVF